MNFIYCTCNAAMLGRITDTLETIKVKNYQVTDTIISQDIKGKPGHNTEDSREHNVTITMQITDSIKSKMILNIFRNINKENAGNSDKMLTVCSWEMENYFID
jgi:hypothetical protein